MPLWKQRLFSRLQNEETGGEGGSGGGGGESSSSTGTELDIEAASASIGADLGLGLDEPPEPKELELDEKGQPKVAAAPAPAPSPAPSPSPAPAPAPAPGQPQAFTADKAPHTWSPAVAAKWATLDPEVRAEIAKRETDMFRGLEQYKGEAGFGRTVQNLVKPLEQAFAIHNVKPEQFIGNLVHAHTVLDSKQYTMEQKLDFAKQLMATYGLELPASDTAPSGAAAEFVDPQVKALQTELAGLKSRLEGNDARVAGEARAQLETSINTFAADPANPYFYEVADDVALLIRGSGGKMPLKEAYDKAVYANPVTRAKETARISAEAVAKAQKETREKADKARKATGANVNTGGHQGSGTAATGSLEDTMAATLKDIKSRQ